MSAVTLGQSRSASQVNVNATGDAETTAVLDQEALLTAPQVAKLLGIARKRVYELDIPVVQVSQRTLRWMLSDVLKWRDRRKVIR